jgi:preprotein translocase SecE subunit
MRRVSWPSAKEVKNTTIITVIAVIFFAVYLFVVDYGLAFFITQLERFVNWLMGGA